MRTAPPDLPDDRLRAALDVSWALDVRGLRYAPVGFGSHHWLATTTSGGRFVTVDDLGPSPADRPPRLERLTAALSTARRLATDARLPCVVAPLPTRDGAGLHLVDDRFAVSVFPLVEGQPWPEAPAAADHEALVQLLADLHGASLAVRDTVGRDDLSIEAQDDLETALGDLDAPWDSGPHATDARLLLGAHAGDVGVLLEVYDDLARAAARHPEPWVVTHGEPKADNLLVTPAGPVLVDWDTVLLAPAARDLWLADSGTGEQLARYREVTGRAVPADQLELFRLRWELTDVALYVREFRGPHTRTADTGIAWGALETTLRQLRSRWGHRLTG